MNFRRPSTLRMLFRTISNVSFYFSLSTARPLLCTHTRPRGTRHGQGDRRRNSHRTPVSPGGQGGDRCERRRYSRRLERVVQGAYFHRYGVNGGRK